MRRVGKILVCAVASLAAAVTTYWLAYLGLLVWAEAGRTQYSDVDVQRLAQAFVAATTLPDGKRQLLGLGRDTRYGMTVVNVAPTVSEGWRVRRSMDRVWGDMRQYGRLEHIVTSNRREGVLNVVLFRQRAEDLTDFNDVRGEPLHLSTGACDIRVGTAPHEGLVLNTRILIAIGSAPPLWSRAAEPCIARGLFASVGLVGNSCMFRPSVLCPEDALRRGTQEDFILLQTLQRARSGRAPGDPLPETDEIARIIRGVLEGKPDAGTDFTNLREERFSHFASQFHSGMMLMGMSDEELLRIGSVPAARWRWILNLRAM